MQAMDKEGLERMAARYQFECCFRHPTDDGRSLRTRCSTTLLPNSKDLHDGGVKCDWHALAAVPLPPAPGGLAALEAAAHAEGPEALQASFCFPNQTVVLRFSVQELPLLPLEGLYGRPMHCMPPLQAPCL